MQLAVLVSWAELLAIFILGMLLLLTEALLRAMVVIGLLLYMLVAD